MSELPRPVQVVVAYDFSPSAEEALQRAIDVACRAPHHVLHVIAAIDARHGLPVRPTHDVNYDYADQLQNMITARITSAFSGRAAASEVQFFVHARIGKPADEILDLAKEVGADLLFVGSHGKTGLERFVLGSVSERIVREAKCPVMVVRHKGYESVELQHVFKYEHERKHWSPPHRYSYSDNRVQKRPDDFPIS